MPEALFTDRRRFTSETLDGETIVIDTQTGLVSVGSGVTSALWERLRAGVTAADLEAEIVERHGPDAWLSCREFIERLQERGMVVTGDAALVETRDEQETAWPSEFTVPVLEHFEDIADILTMDPIHDVDAAQGWPRAGG